MSKLIYHHNIIVNTTPRTSQATWVTSYKGEVVYASFAETLEEELNEANAQNKKMRNTIKLLVESIKSHDSFKDRTSYVKGDSFVECAIQVAEKYLTLDK